MVWKATWSLLSKQRYLSVKNRRSLNNIHSKADIMEKYRKGALGALPDPELINSLLDIKGNKKGEVADEE